VKKLKNGQNFSLFLLNELCDPLNFFLSTLGYKRTYKNTIWTKLKKKLKNFCIRMPNQASPISKEDIIKAVFLHQKGKSYSEIGNELNRSKSCIKTIIDRYNETKSYDDRPRSGRPRISTEKDERQLVRLVKKNRTLTITYSCTQLEIVKWQKSIRFLGSA